MATDMEALLVIARKKCFDGNLLFFQHFCNYAKISQIYFGFW